jgi:hypothetical protein
MQRRIKGPEELLFQHSRKVAGSKVKADYLDLATVIESVPEARTDTRDADRHSERRVFNPE